MQPRQVHTVSWRWGRLKMPRMNSSFLSFLFGSSANIPYSLTVKSIHPTRTSIQVMYIRKTMCTCNVSTCARNVYSIVFNNGVYCSQWANLVAEYYIRPYRLEIADIFPNGFGVWYNWRRRKKRSQRYCGVRLAYFLDRHCFPPCFFDDSCLHFVFFIMGLLFKCNEAVPIIMHWTELQSEWERLDYVWHENGRALFQWGDDFSRTIPCVSGSKARN